MPVGERALDLLRGQHDRRERVLDLVGDLPRHLAPGRVLLGLDEPAVRLLQVRGHAVERVREERDLVVALDAHPGVEVSARDALA